jgi:peroxiredoxin
MQAYRDRYAEIQKLNGRVIAVSADDAETLKKWRDELKAPQTFIADPDKKLIALYDTKMPIVPIAQRRTFVIGTGRKVLELQEGNEAIDPEKSVRACGLRKPPAAATPATPAPASTPSK